MLTQGAKQPVPCFPRSQGHSRLVSRSRSCALKHQGSLLRGSVPCTGGHRQVCLTPSTLHSPQFSLEQAARWDAACQEQAEVCGLRLYSINPRQRKSCRALRAASGLSIPQHFTQPRKKYRWVRPQVPWMAPGGCWQSIMWASLFHTSTHCSVNAAKETSTAFSKLWREIVCSSHALVGHTHVPNTHWLSDLLLDAGFYFFLCAFSNLGFIKWKWSHRITDELQICFPGKLNFWYNHGKVSPSLFYFPLTKSLLKLAWQASSSEAKRQKTTLCYY